MNIILILIAIYSSDMSGQVSAAVVDKPAYIKIENCVLEGNRIANEFSDNKHLGQSNWKFLCSVPLRNGEPVNTDVRMLGYGFFPVLLTDGDGANSGSLSFMIIDTRYKRPDVCWDMAKKSAIVMNTRLREAERSQTFDGFCVENLGKLSYPQRP